MFLGECPNIGACRYRHRLSSADKANRDSKYSPVRENFSCLNLNFNNVRVCAFQVPTAGQVKVRVTHVVDATHYYGVCKAVKHGAGDIEKLEDLRESISNEIKAFLRLVLGPSYSNSESTE